MRYALPLQIDMKVPASVRRLFEDQKVKNERLREVVDKRVQGFKDARWHYESRVKQLLSYALKVESGRFAKPAALEDFFACTLVVANVAEIERAEQIICTNFALKERRPPDGALTHKSPEEFPFDDLRLYVSLPQDPSMPPTDLTDLVFEVQVKTFLQHAWSIATHDLLYKTDDANWSKERIAYQTKAMLEHAEVSIQEAESLATTSALAKENSRTTQIKAGIALVKQQWTADELPADIRRLAQNVLSLLDGLHINLGRLEAVLEHGKEARSGTHPTNLSPFATIIQYLFKYEKDKLSELLTRDARKSFRVLIPDEVEIPEDLDRGTLRNAIFVS